jgi:hypothetical protein
MKENKVITEIEQLTPERLTTIFKNKGYLSQGKVTKIIKKSSQETYTSNVYFLELEISNDAHSVPASSEIVVKIPIFTTFLQPFVKIIGRHEAKFYSVLADSLEELPIPISYDVVYSEETGLSHIIIESLSKTHIDGESYSPDLPPKQYCERAIDSLAEIHAYWWDHIKLKELSKHSYVLYHYNKESPTNKQEIFKWFNNQKKSLERFLKFLGDRISENRKELFKEVFSLFPQVVHERLKKKNITLIHGDTHLWNFFFPKDMGYEKLKAYLIDWQSWSIGVGCQDLAYMFFIHSFNPDFRDLMEKDLLKRYHNNLLKLGIKSYDWDNCWYDYKLFHLLNLFKIVQRWGVKTSSNFWLRLGNSIDAIEDLNCIGLLESK